MAPEAFKVGSKGWDWPMGSIQEAYCGGTSLLFSILGGTIRAQRGLLRSALFLASCNNEKVHGTIAE